VTIPGAQVAVSPGRQTMLHAAHVPTAGALHDAPTAAFSFFWFFFVFSPASADAEQKESMIRLMSNRFVIVGSLN
jgi:hypothetical protein